VTAVCLSVLRDLSACLQGRSARNNIQANTEEEPEEVKEAPHSLSTAVVLVVMLLSLQESLEK
jgi:hypothetical protein